MIGPVNNSGTSGQAFGGTLNFIPAKGGNATGTAGDETSGSGSNINATTGDGGDGFETNAPSSAGYYVVGCGRGGTYANDLYTPGRNSGTGGGFSALAGPGGYTDSMGGLGSGPGGLGGSWIGRGGDASGDGSVPRDGGSMTLDTGTPIGGGVAVLSLGISATAINAGNATCTTTINGLFVANQHIKGGGATPGIAPGAGLGISPTVALVGTDIAGEITLTVGTVPATGILATVTYATAYGTKPNVVLTPVNSRAADAPLTSAYVYVDTEDAGTDASGFVIKVDVAALAATSAYKYTYMVIQ